jgi:hypothetical protein
VTEGSRAGVYEQVDTEEEKVKPPELSGRIAMRTTKEASLMEIS